MNKPLLLILILIICTNGWTATFPVEKQEKINAIKKQIEQANYCVKKNDCGESVSVCPFNCHVIVNAFEQNRIAKLIVTSAKEFPCEYMCEKLRDYVCFEGKCQAIMGSEIPAKEMAKEEAFAVLVKAGNVDGQISEYESHYNQEVWKFVKKKNKKIGWPVHLVYSSQKTKTLLQK